MKSIKLVFVGLLLCLFSIFSGNDNSRILTPNLNNIKNDQELLWVELILAVDKCRFEQAAKISQEGLKLYGEIWIKT